MDPVEARRSSRRCKVALKFFKVTRIDVGKVHGVLYDLNSKALESGLISTEEGQERLQSRRSDLGG